LDDVIALAIDVAGFTVFEEETGSIDGAVVVAVEQHAAETGFRVVAEEEVAAAAIWFEQGIPGRVFIWVVFLEEEVWSYPDLVDSDQGFTGESVRVLMNCCS
jgi:hypothetical protein